MATDEIKVGDKVTYRSGLAVVTGTVDMVAAANSAMAGKVRVNVPGSGKHWFDATDLRLTKGDR